MDHPKELFGSAAAYGAAVTSFITSFMDNFDIISRAVVFLGGMVLMVLQIKLHLIRIKKERSSNDNTK